MEVFYNILSPVFLHIYKTIFSRHKQNKDRDLVTNVMSLDTFSQNSTQITAAKINDTGDVGDQIQTLRAFAVLQGSVLPE